jgi:phage protein D
MSALNTKSTKFEFQIQDTWSTARRPKSQRKAEEGHLEEGKVAKLTNGMKRGKPKKEQRKAQAQNSP